MMFKFLCILLALVSVQSASLDELIKQYNNLPGDVQEGVVDTVVKTLHKKYPNVDEDTIHKGVLNACERRLDMHTMDPVFQKKLHDAVVAIAAESGITEEEALGIITVGMIVDEIAKSEGITTDEAAEMVGVGLGLNMLIEEFVQKGMTTEEATDVVLSGYFVTETANAFGISPDEAIELIMFDAVVEEVAAETGLKEEQVADVILTDMLAEEIAAEEGVTKETVLAEMGTMIDEIIPDSQVVSAIEKALGAIFTNAGTPAPTPAPTAVKKIGEHITDMISQQLTP